MTPPRWTIQTKLVLGLALVLTMIVILLGGAIQGLRTFSTSHAMLVDQLRELGAAGRLLEQIVRLDSRETTTPEGRSALTATVNRSREALEGYHRLLIENRAKGNRFDDGMDELIVAFKIDENLTALLAELKPDAVVEPVMPGTRSYRERLNAEAKARRALRGETGKTDQPGARSPGGDEEEDEERNPSPEERLERLERAAMQLPGHLYRDFYNILEQSRRDHAASTVIVWTSAVLVLFLLLALAYLVHRWVLYPVRLLHRGVRRVGRGAFDFRILLQTGDEMQSLAEAFNDMTARIRATYDDLERQVQERSRQLIRSERLAGVGFLAAGVAHEINNPLASIAFCAEALERRLISPNRSPSSSGGEEGDAVRDYLRMIQEEAFRCKRITEKLLDFSRTSELRRAPTELNALVTDVVEMVRHLGKYRGKSIEVKSTEAVYALADAQEIKQVALNLVVNALDSVDPGGWLVITLRYAEGMAEMEFVDNGKGMTPEVLENIFEPFFTTRPVGKGTGLGLSITHRIISQHDGLIFAESDGPDRGARFVVRLPVAPGVFDADSDSRIRAIAGPSDEGPDPSRGKVFHAA